MMVRCTVRLRGSGPDWGCDESAAKAFLAGQLRWVADKIQGSNDSEAAVTIVDDDSGQPYGMAEFWIGRDL